MRIFHYTYTTQLYTQGQILANVSSNETRESCRRRHCHGNDDDTKARCSLRRIQVIQPLTVTRIRVHSTSAVPPEICAGLNHCEIWTDLYVQRVWQQMSSRWERERQSLCVLVYMRVCACQRMCERTAGLESAKMIHTSLQDLLL